jgi:conjugal transfer pilus assembly protein TraB
MLADIKQKWDDMDPKWRTVFICVLIAGPAFIYFQHQKNAAAQASADKLRVEKMEEIGRRTPGEAVNFGVLPSSPRNQGLEDLATMVEQLRQELSDYKSGRNATPSSQPQNIQVSPPQSVDLSMPIETRSGAGGLNLAALDEPTPTKNRPDPIRENPAPQINPPKPSMKAWQPLMVADKPKEELPDLVIPVNSGIEGVLLTGVNARPSGATAGAVGTSTSANTVGAPFVTKLKGDAVLPNGWKLADLGDCFLGGSAIAVLSAERAYAISDTLSCIAPNGDVYEGPVKAFGVDVDGIQGLSGKVVSKQGAILARAFLTGIASGLGTALAPTAIPGFNNAATSGSTQFQTPDPSMVARTAVGTGMQNAASQLSRFYLEFARETFPVIEIPATTRITWILKESLVLKKKPKGTTR